MKEIAQKVGFFPGTSDVIIIDLSGSLHFWSVSAHLENAKKSVEKTTGIIEEKQTAPKNLEIENEKDKTDPTKKMEEEKKEPSNENVLLKEKEEKKATSPSKEKVEAGIHSLSLEEADQLFKLPPSKKPLISSKADQIMDYFPQTLIYPSATYLSKNKRFLC